MMDCMVDYNHNQHALTIQDQNIVVKVRPSLRRSTIGWFICIQCKYGSTSWEKLSDMKEFYPVETEQYAVPQGIDHEPAYNWWVGHMIHKIDNTILAVKERNDKYIK